jgi:hypothetical protein
MIHDANLRLHSVASPCSCRVAKQVEDTNLFVGSLLIRDYLRHLFESPSRLAR